MVYKLLNIQRVFEKRKVLDIDELFIRDRSITALLGANGAGKSTLLNILAFLDSPSSGSMSFLGGEVVQNGNSPFTYRKKVVLVDQSPLLFSGSVWKNVEFGLKVRKIPASERKERIQNALELVGMENFASAKAQRLSGGETKRVALARALAVNPQVLLLDEPTANVDVTNQEIILEIIQKVNEEQGTTIIFSTHQMSESRRLAHHSLMLRHGKLIPQQEKNTFSGKVISCDMNSATCELFGSDVQIKIPIKGRCSSGQNVKITFFSEKLKFIKPGCQLPEENSFGAEVLSISRRPKKVHYKVNMGVDLEVVSSFEDYQAYPVPLGSSVLFHVPLDGLEVEFAA